MLLILFLSLLLAVRGAARLMRGDNFADDLTITASGVVIAIIATVMLSRAAK